MAEQKADAATDLVAGTAPAASGADEGEVGAALVGRHRDHRFPGRGRRVTVRLGEEEYGAVVGAAGRAGLTTAGYVGAVVVAAARGKAAPASSQVQVALAELMAARAQVRRFGGNVNQAVAQLNGTGEAPEWLASAVAIAARAVRRVDEAAELLMRRRS